MNILHDNIIYTIQRTGGISVVWSELQQRATKDTNLSLKVLDYPNCNIHRTALVFRKNQIAAMPLRHLERYRTPAYQAQEGDVFHSSYFRYLPQKGVKNITTIHDLTYHNYRSGLARSIHLWQESQALNHSAGVICVSESTKRDLLSFYPRLNEEHICVIHNGVSHLFAPSEEPNITPFDDQGYLLFVGNRQVAYKNFPIAVSVARQVNMPLVIVGAKLTKDEHKLLTTNLGREHYHALCHVSQHDLNTLYSHAFCLLYPSAYEGFGLPILEAQRTLCPVLGQNTSSIPEVMGEGGIIVESTNDADELTQRFSEQVIALRNGSIHRDELTAKGWRNSQQFSWDNTHQQLVQFYSNINQQ